uniref:VIP1 protein n=4 Tax=Triticinae TaxID=1648030 RepID=A0A453FAN1_AEGTS
GGGERSLSFSSRAFPHNRRRPSRTETTLQDTKTHRSPMENGDETLVSPAAAASAEVEKAAPNGDVAGEEVTLADAVHPAKSYAAVAANAEIEDLRATKLDLEEQLANASQENKTLAAEAHRLEGLFSQARDDVATAEHAAATTEEEVASLRAEVERLQALLDRKKADREADERQRQELTAEVETVRQAKLKLEKEIDALKASADATTVKDREAAPDAGVPKEEGVAWQGMAAGAAAGAAITAAVVLIYLRLKR